MASSKSNKGRNDGGVKIHHQAPVVASGNTSASGLLDAVAKQKTETLSGYIRQIVEALTKVSELSEQMVHERIVGVVFRDKSFGKASMEKATGLMLKARVLLSEFENVLEIDTSRVDPKATKKNGSHVATDDEVAEEGDGDGDGGEADAGDGVVAADAFFDKQAKKPATKKPAPKKGASRKQEE